MNTDLRQTLKDLLKVKLEGGFIVSVYLDASTDAKGNRHYGTFLKKRFPELERSVEPHSPLLQAIKTDIKEINRYLDEKLDSKTKGVALFISQEKKIFTAFQTVVPFENKVALSKLPYVYPLVRLADDYDRYGVGWADQRHKRHLQDQITKHVKAAAAHARRFFKPGEVSHIVLSAENGTLSEFKEQLPQEISQKLIVTSKLDVKASTGTIVKESLKLFKIEENEGSRRMAERVVVLARGRGGKAVAGTDQTLGALMDGRAEHLVIEEKYNDNGWRCDNCLRLGAGGKVSRCPYCNSSDVNLNPDLKEEFVELAVRRGLKVEFVEGSKELSANGGIGALLQN